jgi:hypothetical protein
MLRLILHWQCSNTTKENTPQHISVFTEDNNKKSGFFFVRIYENKIIYTIYN